eukprot:gene26922-35317_t
MTSLAGVIVNSQATTTWVLGATGDSCATTCSNFLPSATCHATATWPKNSSALQATQSITYDLFTNQIQTNCTGAAAGGLSAIPPSNNGVNCYYTTAATTPLCSTSAAGFRLFCPCSLCKCNCITDHVFWVIVQINLILSIVVASLAIDVRWILGPASYTCNSTCKASMAFSYCVSTTAGITTAFAMTALEATTYDIATNQIQSNCTGAPYGQLDSTSYATPMFDGKNCWYGTGTPACYKSESGLRLFCPCAIPPIAMPSVSLMQAPTISPSTVPSPFNSFVVSYFNSGNFSITFPLWVSSVDVFAVGASGGADSTAFGGFGAIVNASFSVIPGATYYFYVGGAGMPFFSNAVASGGFNGGGNGGAGSGAGGGGATDIRTGNSLSSRILVAGAGGGGRASSSHGGNGGGNNGYLPLNNSGDGSFPGGGSQTSGGTAAMWSPCEATAGSLGQGGSGVNSCTFNDGGGGGGAGYYGGGGGDANGGAGGSSYCFSGCTKYTV